MKRLDIKILVNKLARKHKTRCPFRLLECLNIILIEEDLDEISGFYSRDYRQKFIHVNRALGDNNKVFVIAHEIGHAIIHPEYSTPFLTKNTLFSMSKFEREANKFAVELLITDEDLQDMEGLCIEQIAASLGFCGKEILKLKLEG